MQPLRWLKTLGKVRLPPNCQHWLKYILTPFLQFPSGILQRPQQLAEVNDFLTSARPSAQRQCWVFPVKAEHKMHRLVVKSEWHHPQRSAQHSRYNTGVLNINSAIPGTLKYRDEKGYPSFEGPTLERERWRKWLIMNGRDGEDVHTGGGEGSERPPS